MSLLWDLSNIRNSAPKLSGDERTLARLSNEVYKGVNDRQNIEDHRQDNEFRGPHHAVYVDKQQRPVIVFRGTKDVADLGVDADILLGQRKHKRFDEAVELERRVRRKYGRAPQLTGHSLGGSIANHVSQKNDNQAVVFNPGSSPFLRESLGKNTRVRRDRNDFISSGFGGNFQVPNILGTLYGHSISRFT